MLLVAVNSLLALSSCNETNSAQILIPKRTETTFTSDTYKYNMTREYHEAFTKGKKSFVLYFGSNRCQYCAELEPLLVDYVQKTKIEIYFIDLYSEEYGNNQDYYIETTSIMSAPNILIYKEGEMVHRERGSQNLTTGVKVNKFFKEHIKTVNYYTVRAEGDIRTNAKKYVTFTYNFNNEEHQELINTRFYPYFTKKGYVNYVKDSETELDAPLLRFGASNEVISIPNNEAEIGEIITKYIDYFR